MVDINQQSKTAVGEYETRQVIDKTIDAVIDRLMAVSQKNRRREDGICNGLRNAIWVLLGLLEYLDNKEVRE